MTIDDTDRLLTPDEVCERLNVTKRWIRRAIEDKLFPRIKIGGLNRFPQSGVEAYIKEQQRAAEEQS